MGERLNLARANLGVARNKIIAACKKLGMKHRGPGFFFWLSLFYLIILIVVAAKILLSANKVEANVVRDEFLFFAVPWFGALGAVTISLYGVFSHNGQWDHRWNYWHFARPFVGTILGAVACLMLFGVVRAANPGQGIAGASVSAASTQIPYFVLAFVVGFREATFRILITRATDLLLGAEKGIRAAERPTATPGRLSFGDVAQGATREALVLVRCPDIQARPTDMAAESFNAAVRVIPDRNDFESPDTVAISAGEGVRAIRVTFHPSVAGDLQAVLVIDLPSESLVVELTGRGVERESSG